MLEESVRARREVQIRAPATESVVERVRYSA
jgi:hypothetical protein